MLRASHMPVALITGISGFIGAHLANAAREAGFDVVGLDRTGTPAPIDLLESAAVVELVHRAKPDVVFHLAGLLHSQDPRALYEVNAGGTAVLLDALKAAKASPRVVVASSSAVYGNPAQTPILETTALRPLTHYGAAKVATEVVALRAYAADRLDVVVARVFNVVGPGQPPTLAAGAFAKQVVAAETGGERILRVGDLSAERDFLDVRDVAAAYLALARTGRSGETYNVSSGTPVPVRRCLDALAALARVPLTLHVEAARFRAVDVRGQVGDNGRIGRDTGWSPRISFDQSMHDLLDSWRMRSFEVGGT